MTEFAKTKISRKVIELVKKLYRIPKTFFFYQNENFETSRMVDGTAFGQLKETATTNFAFFLMQFMDNEIISA